MIDIYYFGSESHEPDRKKAYQYYLSGIEKCSLDKYVCHFDLGLMYKYGDDIPKDMTKAVIHFEEAHKEMDDPEIDITLGRSYLFGENGKEQDLSLAHDYLLNFTCHVSEDDKELLDEFDEIVEECEDKEFLHDLFLELKEIMDDGCAHHHECC